MKLYWRILLLLLALVLALSVFIGCEKIEEIEGPGEEGEDDVSSFFPDVEKTNYGLDFNILNAGGHYLAIEEDDNTGSPIDEAVYNRQGKVEKYLGVDIIQLKIVDQFMWRDYPNYIQTAVQNMDGTIDFAVGASYNGKLVSDNLIQDFTELEYIDLEAEYWNLEFMENLELNGCQYLGFGDYDISVTCCVSFNKDMLAQYASSLDKSLYDTVKDMEWTFDKMYEVSQLVYTDKTGDGKTEDDIYGLRGRAWHPFRNITQAANIPIFEMDESGSYLVAINQAKYFEKTDNLVTLLREMRDSKGVWFHYQQPNDSGEVVKGKSLMFLSSTTSLESYLDYNADFGVLPYPMYNTDQASVGYKSLHNGGFLLIPSYLKNTQMTCETLEMLSFYSANVNITYFEKMLGKQVADMPDDKAMLDLIWGGLCSDVGEAYIDAYATSGNTSGLAYIFGELVSLNQAGSKQNLASYISAKAPTMNSNFRKFVNGVKK